MQAGPTLAKATSHCARLGATVSEAAMTGVDAMLAEATVSQQLPVVLGDDLLCDMFSTDYTELYEVFAS